VESVDAFIDSMEMFENEYSCSGMCQPGLFWFTQPVTLARPTEMCIFNLVEMSMTQENSGAKTENHEELITKLQWGSEGTNQWGGAANAFEQGGSGGSASP